MYNLIERADCYGSRSTISRILLSYYTIVVQSYILKDTK